MSKVSLIIILLLKTGMSFAQEYFVFIGADNKQPFYVRVDSQFHSSTAEGHLILAQLRDSTYAITIGFPGQTLPEQHYTFSIHGRDQAFELQQQGQDGLRLYDLQAKEWLSPQSGTARGDEFRSVGIKKDDAFSRMMAGVVRDTAVLYNTYAMEQALNDSPAVAKAASSADTGTTTAQPGTMSPQSTSGAGMTALPPTSADTANSRSTANVTPTAIGDSAGSTSAETILTSAPNTAATSDAASIRDTGSSHNMTKASNTSPIPSTVGAPLYRPAARIKKLSEHRSARNLRLVYADHSDGKKVDTVVVIIPIDSPVKTSTRQLHTADTAVAVKTLTRQLHTGDTPVTARTPARQQAVPFINSDCHDFATDFDVDKLRVKMLQVSRDDERVAIARKTFKVKCFSTRQIRSLSEVFTSDAAKFRFLEAAWPFAADEHFHELSDLLTDPVYKSRFKTMTHTQ